MSNEWMLWVLWVNIEMVLVTVPKGGLSYV
jgi:hypothetical protein